MIRTHFGDDTHWDLGGAFLSVRRIGHRRWRAAVAKLANDGEYSTVQRTTHGSRASAINVGIRALQRAAKARRS